MRHERGRPPYPELLTPAEQRVLGELRSGYANAEIAERLGISVNTVRYHVSNMLGKLELPNRAALRAWNEADRDRHRGWLGLAGLLGGRGTSGAGVLEGVTPGFGLKILDAATFELVAHVVPGEIARQVEFSPDSRFAYLVTDGPGRPDDPNRRCSEDCKVLAVVDLEDGSVVGQRMFDTVDVSLVGLAPS